MVVFGKEGRVGTCVGMCTYVHRAHVIIACIYCVFFNLMFSFTFMSLG